MDEEKIRNLISQAKEEYNHPTMTLAPFKKWADSFEGGEEYNTVKSIYDFIYNRNKRPSTFLWRISDFFEEEIFKYVSSVNIQSR